MNGIVQLDLDNKEELKKLKSKILYVNERRMVSNIQENDILESINNDLITKF